MGSGVAPISDLGVSVFTGFQCLRGFGVYGVSVFTGFRCLRGFGVYGVFGRSLVIGLNCRRPKGGRSVREFYSIGFSLGS